MKSGNLEISSVVYCRFGVGIVTHPFMVIVLPDHSLGIGRAKLLKCKKRNDTLCTLKVFI